MKTREELQSESEWNWSKNWTKNEIIVNSLYELIQEITRMDDEGTQVDNCVVGINPRHVVDHEDETKSIDWGANILIMAGDDKMLQNSYQALDYYNILNEEDKSTK